MKKLLPLLLALCLLLCSCSGGTETTTENGNTNSDMTFRNPLNGTILSEPYSGRVFSVTINNVSPALPFKGVNSADVFFEIFINDYCTRGLALYSDIKNVADIGSIRSTRYNFTDISLAYNTVMIHANASGVVLEDMRQAGIDNILADVPVGYRDQARLNGGYSLEHTLFSTGENLYNAASDRGFALSLTDKYYGMNFSDEVNVDGNVANTVEIVFTLNGIKKITEMSYDMTSDRYVFSQYGKEMKDENDGNPVSFKNVIVILAPTENQDVYHVADLYGSGDGYYACGGKIIPIKWVHQNETDPFTFTLSDGTPLTQETGSTYIAIAPTGSPVNAQ